MAQSQGAIPTDPSLSLSLGRRRRGCNNPRAFARNRRETGSLETAPSATPSLQCSHSGIAPGLTAVFSLYVGRFRRSREKRRRNEGRLRRGGSRSAGDRLASRVSWFGVGAPGTPARGRRMKCCRPGESARGMDPSYIPRMSRIKFLIGLAEGLLGGPARRSPGDPPVAPAHHSRPAPIPTTMTVHAVWSFSPNFPERQASMTVRSCHP